MSGDKGERVGVNLGKKSASYGEREEPGEGKGKEIAWEFIGEEY